MPHLSDHELALRQRQHKAVAWAGRQAAGGWPRLEWAGRARPPLRCLAVQAQLLLDLQGGGGDEGREGVRWEGSCSN